MVLPDCFLPHKIEKKTTTVEELIRVYPVACKDQAGTLTVSKTPDTLLVVRDLRIMPNKSKSRKAGAHASQSEQSSGDDRSPETKKMKSGSQEEEEYDSASELDEEDLKVANYIRKMVKKDIGKIVADSITASLNPVINLVTEANKKSDEAVATAKEALDVSKNVEQAQAKTAEEVVELRARLDEQGKQIQELRLNSGDSSKSFWSQAAGSSSDGSTLFEETVQPTSTAADRLKKLFDNFTAKVHAAKTTRTFILGRKKGETPVVLEAAKILMDCFFPDVACIVTKLDKAKAAKVYVPKSEDADRLRNLLDSTWQALGSQGWWLREDQPEELTKLEARGRTFFAEARKHSNELDKMIGYVTVKYGVALKDGKELLPLFLVPPKSSVWPGLFVMIANRVDSMTGGELLGQYGESDDDFYLKWIDSAGLSKLAEDVRAVRDNK